MNPADVYVERVVDLLDPALNRLHNCTQDEARARVLSGDAAQVATIDGSFAILARNGKTVRMARTLDRPMRYFLAKRHQGPALIVADRMDAIRAQLEKEGMQVVKQVNGESFRKAVAPAYAEFAKEFGADKIAAIQAVK